MFETFTFSGVIFTHNLAFLKWIREKRQNFWKKLLVQTSNFFYINFNFHLKEGLYFSGIQSKNPRAIKSALFQKASGQSAL